jgi:hypothetical protein
VYGGAADHDRPIDLMTGPTPGSTAAAATPTGLLVEDAVAPSQEQASPPAQPPVATDVEKHASNVTPALGGPQQAW